VQYFLDEKECDDGTEIVLGGNPPAPTNCSPTQNRRRFDRNRNGLFHDVFYAHARAKPKSLPCLTSLDPLQARPTYFNTSGTCTVASNPGFNALNYNVPSSTSGIADLPGSRVMVALGGWDATAFIGSTFVQASATTHELGHNLGLYHGGATPNWGNATTA